MKTTRAYSLLELRTVDDEKRTIEGVATTPTPDRMNDIIELDGIDYRIPMPFLYQHNARQPIGKVVSAKVVKDQMLVKIQIAAAGVAQYIDEAWNVIKAGLVQGLSIGFRGIEEAWNKETGGYRFIKTELYEISAVTIPANAECSILTVKSLDTELLAALGNERSGVVRLDKSFNLPGASGPTKARGRAMKKTTTDQIGDFENKIAANRERLNAIVATSIEEGRTFEESEKEEKGTLEREIDDMTEHVATLKAYEERMKTAARPVTQENTSDQARASATRGGVISVKSNAPKGIGMARMAIAMWHARNNHRAAADLCSKHWPDQPELAITLKSIVEAGDTTTSGWASQLVPAAQQLQQDFLDMYRAQTILGRIPGLRGVPFNVAVPLRTGAGTFQWVGEAAAKPVTSETFDRVSLLWHKAAAITVITQELARFSSPSAEAEISASMRETIVRFLDLAFIGTAAEVSGVSPAGILNAVSSTAVSGTTPSAFRVDMFNMLNNFTANSVPLTGIALLMSETQALALSMMVTDLGVPLYPTVSAQGGTLFGRPVIVSEAVGTKIIAVKASDILIAQDPGATITVSDQATLEMETAPAVGEQSPPTTQSVLKSMFQNNCLAIRCEQFISWKRARTAAVEYITANAYVPS